MASENSQQNIENKPRQERLTVLVTEEGDVIYVYNPLIDSIFRDSGFKGVPKRASSVEPIDDSNWEADLSRVGGPVLGPFSSRDEAVDAELEWLNENIHTIESFL